MRQVRHHRRFEVSREHTVRLYVVAEGGSAAPYTRVDKRQGINSPCAGSSQPDVNARVGSMPAVFGEEAGGWCC